MVSIARTAYVAVAIGMATTMAATTVAYAQKDKPEPKPAPKYEAVQKGDKPEPKPVPKNELYLIEGRSGSYLLDRAQLDRVSSEAPPTCKVKCTPVAIDGKQVSISESALSSFKLSPPAETYFKENTRKFGSSTGAWPPPVTPDVANAVGAGANVLVLPQF